MYDAKAFYLKDRAGVRGEVGNTVTCERVAIKRWLF